MMQRSLVSIRLKPAGGWCRFMSSSSSASPDTRLAGRRRFYKHVGTTPVAPPWENPLSSDVTVESPISAGVDGTQSASGVSLDNIATTTEKILLQPRDPHSNKPLEDCSWYGVTLDGRTLRTPLGKLLAVPSENLAWAIAAEWDHQEKEITPAQMPLMTLCCTAMDQVVAAPQAYQEAVLRYLPTDTTCYWADPVEDRVLHRKQQQAWQGLHDYCQTLWEERPAVALGASEAVIMSRVRTQKQIGLPHPPQLLQRAQEWVHTLDAWHLCAMHSVTAESKSFLVGMAVLLSNDAMNPCYEVKNAVIVSRVEEEFQIENWGLVEGGHDYDRLNCAIQIHAAHFMTSSIALGTQSHNHEQ